MKETYDSVLARLKHCHFYIFGMTAYAHFFYLYCVEKELAQNIDAFLVSDLNRDKRKVHMLHGIPVRDINWLKNIAQPYPVFLAAKEAVIQKQVLPLFATSGCSDVFYVSEFVHNVMYSYFINSCFQDIIKRYAFTSNLLGAGLGNISDIGSTNCYKYCHRIAVGDCPDPNIFHGNMKLDELHQKQLGDYITVVGTGKIPVNPCKYKIYTAKSHFDKMLKEDFYTPFTIDIQVGAALTDMDIAECKDNAGENISIRNKDYCEMSAVYWVWKHDKDSDYIGVCHYRRRFVINESMMDFIAENNFDAVYTVPHLSDGGMRKEFVERNYFLTPEDWEVTGRVLSRLCPEYYDAWLEFETSYFIIPCNMFIMQKEVFDRYCSWVFPILKEIDRYYLKQGIPCDNRYLGYISECLTTLYVMKHKETLKKGYVGMKTLESGS